MPTRPPRTSVARAHAPESGPVDTAPVETAAPSQRAVVAQVTLRGAPASGATVAIESLNGAGTFYRAVADDDGVARLMLPPRARALRVTAMSPGYAMVSCETNLAEGVTPLAVVINLEQAGVVITAELRGPDVAAVSQCFARITPAAPRDWAAVGGATAAQCVERHIVFPAIAIGLSNLRVTVQAPELAPAISAPFDTADGCDKTVIVETVSGVHVRGQALYASGGPLQSFRLVATPRGRFETKNSPGHYDQLLDCETDGSYGPITLLPEFYRFTVSSDEAQGYATNVLLAAEDNIVDFLFDAFSEMTVRGQVIHEDTQQPAPDVTVQWLPWSGEDGTNVVTDADGRFAMTVRAARSSRLVIDMPNYARTEMGLYDYDGEELLLVLRGAGTIVGKVMLQDRTPVQGVTINLSPVVQNETSVDSELHFMQRRGRGVQQRQTFHVNANKISDELGEFAISNVMAPATHTIYAWHPEYAFVGMPDATNPPIFISVAQGETTYCELLMRTQPTLLLKVLDRQGVPATTYQLAVEIQSAEYSSQSRIAVELAGQEWYRLHLNTLQPRAKVNLCATLTDGSSALTNGLVVRASDSNEVVMFAQEDAGETLRGYIYDSEENPLDEIFISASYPKRYGHAQTDPLGYFEMPELRPPTGTMVYLYLMHQQQSFRTNMLFMNTPLEWVLPNPRTLRGRVCIDSPATPATNFNIAIMDPHNSRRFTSEDGTFSLPIDEWMQQQQFMLYAAVEDYAPTQVACNMRGMDELDVGDIIVQGSAARVAGRVVNDINEPLSAWVSLRGVQKGVNTTLQTQSDQSEGRFAFSGLPVGSYTVSASIPNAPDVRSDAFTLQYGDDKLLPDLVIVTTNLPLVQFLFVLPDSRPAANVRIDQLGIRSDEQGRATTRVRCNTYQRLRAVRGEDVFIAENFTITPDTHSLTVQLTPSPRIGGTITIDGRPLEDGYVVFTPERGTPTNGRVADGQFSVAATPGRYLITSSSSRSATAIVDLREGDNNFVALRRGSASLSFDFPEQEQWSLMAWLQFGENVALVDYSHGAGRRLSGLPAGFYRINAQRADNQGGFSNLTTRLSVGSGADVPVRF
jgi:hypothetical protein